MGAIAGTRPLCHPRGTESVATMLIVDSRSTKR